MNGKRSNLESMSDLLVLAELKLPKTLVRKELLAEIDKMYVSEIESKVCAHLFQGNPKYWKLKFAKFCNGNEIREGEMFEKGERSQIKTAFTQDLSSTFFNQIVVQSIQYLRLRMRVRPSVSAR